MTRVCSGCGKHSCDGRCYLESPADYPTEDEAPAPREKYIPSPEYLAWCADIDSKRTTVVHSDPLLKSRRAAA